jgi:hypothetical protein
MRNRIAAAMGESYSEFETMMRRGGSASLAAASRFFMRDDPVYQTLRGITSKLDQLAIPYAIVGGMALVAHGYDRTTVDVDILVTPASLAAIHERLEGLGYVALFKGGKSLRDASTKVKIEFLTTGGFPGDGKPKPVSFPDPADVSTRIDGISYLNLPTLLELKLASGISNIARAKDLGDAVELIKIIKLPKNFGETLNRYVQPKFYELWDAVQNDPLKDDC